MLPELGILDLGENRPQELWKKAKALRDDIRWHLIGHLQRNKIEDTLPKISLLHSVDSLRLLQAIDKEAVKQELTPDVLLEVNVSGEKSKHGFSIKELDTVIEAASSLKAVRLRGLMTMAPLVEPEECRPVFASLREARDCLQSQLSGEHDLVELSMGMSNDFEVAVEQGATLVRLGTVLWEGVES